MVAMPRVSATPDAQLETFREGFFSRFEALRARLRRRQLATTGLDAALLALVAGATGLALVELHASTPLRLAALGTAGVGACAYGVWTARRRRLTAVDAALYFDAQSDSGELLVSVLELETSATASSALPRRADQLLGKLERQPRLPKLWWKRHLTLAPLLALTLWLATRPLPPPGAHAAAQQARISAAGLKLDTLKRLSNLPAHDAEQAKRLRRLADAARQLEQQLQRGMERREAQHALASLSDGLREEHLELSSRDERQGREAAMAELEKSEATRALAKALGDGDLIELDQAMQQLSQRWEQESRKQALQALTAAEKAAREHGAARVADALGEQRRRTAALDALMDGLRAELGDKLPEALNPTPGSKGAADGAKLSEALSKAIEGLSPEQRRRLAKRLGEQLTAPGSNPGEASPRELAKMLEQLERPGGAKALGEQLRRFADSPSAQREKRLREAERELRQAERQLGLLPVPGPAAPGGGPGRDGRDGTPGSGSPGSGGGGGPKASGSSSPPLAANELRSRAPAAFDPRFPEADVSRGQAPATPGVQSQRPVQAPRGAKGNPGSLSGADDHSVPEEYRDQVGRYFAP